MRPASVIIPQLVGVQYRLGEGSFVAADCWGVVELYYRHVLGLELTDRSRHPSTRGGIDAWSATANDWQRIKKPEDHCLVLMRAGRLSAGHIGVYFKGQVVHASAAAGQCVCEPITDRTIQNSLTGYLRRKNENSHS